MLKTAPGGVNRPSVTGCTTQSTGKVVHGPLEHVMNSSNIPIPYKTHTGVSSVKKRKCLAKFENVQEQTAPTYELIGPSFTQRPGDMLYELLVAEAEKAS